MSTPLRLSGLAADGRTEGGYDRRQQILRSGGIGRDRKGRPYVGHTRCHEGRYPGDRPRKVK